MLFMAQVRFAEILLVQRHVPAIQDAIRAQFPIFKRSVIKSLSFENGTPTISDNEIWHFEDVQSTTGLVLTRDSISFQTTAYKTFELALPIFEESIRAIHQILSIGAATRCGLRYIDVIYPGEAQSLATYLRPEILGLYVSKLDMEPLVQMSVYTGKSPLGRLVVKFSTSSTPNVLPPDLAPITLNLNLQIPEGASVGTLDFDHFADIAEVFSVERVCKLLGDLHDAIALAFDACVMPEALELWGKRNA